ncbi:MAG: DJ-1/PfpI family protein [Bacteroidota bacterium]
MNSYNIFFALIFGITFAYPQSAYNVADVYICPPCDLPCDTKEYDKPGKCAACTMTLMKKEKVKTIAFYLQDRVEVLDFAGPMEVLSYAGFKVFTVSATKDPIKSQGILSVNPDYSIENAPKADILAFFGGNASAASQNPKVIEWVREQENVAYYFSVCTGAFVLAEAGILDGKTATTFHRSLDNLQNSYPKIEVKKNVRFVDNGKVITTAGISAGIDGALHLVAKLQGLKPAKRVAHNMEYDNWKPGDGLILSDDSPYKEKTSMSFLKEFEGMYQFEAGQIQIMYNTSKEDLYAIINDTPYPIFHEERNVFSDINSDLIYFRRNDSNKVIGYSLSENGELFKKLTIEN